MHQRRSEANDRRTVTRWCIRAPRRQDAVTCTTVRTRRAVRARAKTQPTERVSGVLRCRTNSRSESVATWLRRFIAGSFCSCWRVDRSASRRHTTNLLAPCGLLSLHLQVHTPHLVSREPRLVSHLARGRSLRLERKALDARSRAALHQTLRRAGRRSWQSGMQHAASALHNTAGPVAQTAGLGNCPQHTCSTRLARPRRRAAPLPNARSTRQGFRLLMALQMPLRSARFKMFK